MRQVNMTSLGDDAPKTLTIAGLEKAKERALEQHLRPRAPLANDGGCPEAPSYEGSQGENSAYMNGLLATGRAK